MLGSPWPVTRCLETRAACPRDITGTNTVSYEKIAEARIAYGGRGRGMEVQQPGWGHQIYDKVTPF